MVQIGRTNKLTIKRKQDFGAHLDGGESGDILLLHKDAPENYQTGDDVEVFVYTDGEDRLRATTHIPYATVGQFAKLLVVANSFSGSYLDWGLQKDLYVPQKEQLTKMEEGKAYFVFIFIDEKTNRITASSKLDKFLSLDPPEYSEGEEVDLIIYDKTDLGYKAVINNSHGGILYKNEVFQKIFIGQQLKGYIKKIREDLKIDLSLQQQGYQGVDGSSQAILKIIKEKGGRIAVTDKSPPEDIYALFGVSKKIFKKAIGALYKKRLITIDTNGIKLVVK
ncbi:MAG: GntR family transcriptional regulator [Desulfobulbaceae bacterium]|uniref:GntR family transcriptional regulator n=1 Tax=Candidatus Desulfobia pelagia TaxID=2841692 RepID=A0A8J6TAY3_9BACT|nr:GntR family transcriptional regulator [Candidatus Desulfobia pelagia]